MTWIGTTRTLTTLMILGPLASGLSTLIAQSGVTLVEEAKRWERVYPAEYPQIEDLHLYSIGHKPDIMKWSPLDGTRYSPGTTTTYDGYLLGSRAGWAVAGFLTGSSSDNWQVVKLPVPYDIVAVGCVDGHWLIAGEGGQVARRTVGGSEFYDDGDTAGVFVDPFLSITRSWEPVNLGTSFSVSAFSAIDQTGLALAGSQVYRSTDTALSWEELDLGGVIHDIDVFQEQFQLLRTISVADEMQIQLLTSPDGLNWTSSWTIPFPYINLYQPQSSLSVIDESTWGESRERLYVVIDANIRTDVDDENWSAYEGYFSTRDGDTWSDHSSLIFHWSYTYGGNGPHITSTRIQWNPLEIPEERQFLRRNGHLGGTYLDRFHLFQQELYVYENNEWEPVFSPYFWPKFTPSTHLVRGDLRFAFKLGQGQSRFVSLSPDGTITEQSIGDATVSWLNLSNLRWIDGLYFASHAGGYAVYASEDFVNWEPVDNRPGSVHGDSVIVGKDILYWRNLIQSSEVNHLSQFSGGTWSDLMVLPEENDGYVYVAGSDAWYSLRTPDDRVVIERLVPGGDPVIVADFVPESWNGYFEYIVAPGGGRAIAYGNSAELAIIEPDGTYHHSHPWEFFPGNNYRVDSILYQNGWYFLKGPVLLRTTDFETYTPIQLPASPFQLKTVSFINGWYYFLGPTLFRTRDFSTFEQMPLPDGEKVISLEFMEDTLYGFTEYALYKWTLAPGYLDSFEFEEGWRHSDWLGWFRIIEEATGDIEHLLLGDCWIKLGPGDEHWMRTEPLGWIYIQEDWSPWLYRLDDGHWYWLDQDSWPGRAWDDAEKEWVEL